MIYGRLALRGIYQRRMVKKIAMKSNSREFSPLVLTVHRFYCARYWRPTENRVYKYSIPIICFLDKLVSHLVIRQAKLGLSDSVLKNLRVKIPSLTNPCFKDLRFKDPLEEALMNLVLLYSWFNERRLNKSRLSFVLTKLALTHVHFTTFN